LVLQCGENGFVKGQAEARGLTVCFATELVCSLAVYCTELTRLIDKAIRHKLTELKIEL
jgi:hypothetical protein